jgi:hypothetical protein
MSLPAPDRGGSACGVALLFVLLELAVIIAVVIAR